jgi:RimJ/RimL family protein N-acetyltransferase
MTSSPGHAPQLKGQRVTLRRPDDDDFRARLAIGWHADIQLLYGHVLEPGRVMTEEDAKKWVAAHQNSQTVWGIYAKAEDQDRLIGGVRLHTFDEGASTCRLAIGIEDPDFHNRGFGSEAIKLALRHAFDDLEIKTVTLRVFMNNQRAIHAYRKCGFRPTHVEPNAEIINGVNLDDLYMAIDAPYQIPASS